MRGRRRKETVSRAASAAPGGDVTAGDESSAIGGSDDPVALPPSPSAGALGLDGREGAALIGCGLTTFYWLTNHDATFPKPRYVCSLPRWLRDELEAWLRAQTVVRLTQTGSKTGA